MAYHHRQQQQTRKGDEEQQLLQVDDELTPVVPVQNDHINTKTILKPINNNNRGRLIQLLLLFSAISLCLLVASKLLFSSFCYQIMDDLNDELHQQDKNTLNHNMNLPCSNVPNNTICCDRTTSFRTDVCIMRGDIRTSPSSSSLHLYTSTQTVVEKIRPYTRKWETDLMSTIDELDLIATTGTSVDHKCDVTHNVTGIVFSTGGYTGNVYHEFNDGLIPLYITAGRFNKQVVFVVLEYHDWWFSKYSDVLSQLTDHPIIDFRNDNRTHCFLEAIVGLQIHDELSVDPSKNSKATIFEFRELLDKAYEPRIRFLESDGAKDNQPMSPEASPEPTLIEKPKLLILSRDGSRGIDNEKELVELCEEIGFDVKVMKPDRTTEMAKIYREINGSDAMIGVHGAAMTHLLFLRPLAAFIQVIPLGTDWAADTYYGEPARKMSLKYISYKILPRESSLYYKYPKDDPVLRDPNSVTAKGWKVTKEVYLDSQSVRLDLNRFLKRLTRVYHYTVSKKNHMDEKWDWSWQLPPKESHMSRRNRR